MLHGGKPLKDSSADRPVDEDARQIGITHQTPADQPGTFICPPDMSTHQHCQAIWPWDALILSPPARYHQGHIKTWFEQTNEFVRMEAQPFMVTHLIILNTKVVHLQKVLVVI